jgi:aspartate-semialdehyde dehydrogenase
MPQSTWLILGAETLAGKEVAELVRERGLPVTLEQCSGAPSAAVLTVEDEEAAVVQPLTVELLAAADAVFLAGGAESAREALSLAVALDPRPAFIDVTWVCEDLPEARLRCPLLEAPGAAPRAGVHTVIHPAALALARLLDELHKQWPLVHAVATICEPASAAGREGIDELHKQTVNLLNFQSLPQAVFDAQVAFNLLPRYGDESGRSLAAVEQRVERHLATYLAPRGIPLPSLRLVHAPVFHGQMISLWVEFAARPEVAAVEAALAAAGFDVRTAEHAPASNVSVAGESGLCVSDLRADGNHPRGMWLWAAADNWRSLAETAILAAATATRTEAA